MLSSNVNKFKYPRDCECEDGCCFCEIQFECNVYNNTNETMLVTQRDFINITQSSNTANRDLNLPLEQLKQMEICQKIIPIINLENKNNFSENENKENDVNLHAISTDDDIILVKLGPSQHLKFVAKARKGIGKEHAKWQPVSVIAFTQTPEIEFDDDLLSSCTNDEKLSIFNSCPVKCFNYDLDIEELEVGNANLCTFCGDCGKQAEEIGKRDMIEVRGVPNEYRIIVETTGALDPATVVSMAFDILQKKIMLFRSELKIYEAASSNKQW